MNHYVIDRRGDRIVSFLLNENNQAIEIHVDEASEDERRDPQVGEIYIGRLNRIVKNLNAAFVDIGFGQDHQVYLPLEHTEGAIYAKKGSSPKLQQDDEVVVQIRKEGSAVKAAAVTTDLELTGEYVVLKRGSGAGVSKKVPQKKREKLKLLAEEILRELSGSFSILLRTNAAGADPKLVKAEAGHLKEKLENLIQVAPHRPAGTCLLRKPAAYLSRLNGVNLTTTANIVVEDEALLEEIKNYGQEHLPSEAMELLKLYRDDLLPLRKLYNLEREMDRALQPKVYLKSGGWLMIEPTEALTVIDVNSGGMGKSGKDKEAMFLKANLEAAGECARQLRLRNISGMILIDFINMADEENIVKLMAYLREELAKDPIRTLLIDRTKLNLVEITRRKTEKSLRESIGR